MNIDVSPETERIAKVHDTRLVSLMVMLGITRIITFNVQDFKRLTGLRRYIRMTFDVPGPALLRYGDLT